MGSGICKCLHLFQAPKPYQCLKNSFLFLFVFLSIGSLGKDNSTGIVTKVVLDTAFLRETTNGVRIKTWQVRITSLTTMLVLTFTKNKGKLCLCIWYREVRDMFAPFGSKM